MFQILGLTVICSRVHVSLVSCSQASSFLYLLHYIYVLVLTTELQAICIMLYWCSIGLMIGILLPYMKMHSI